jgi:hypothetical protein
MVAIHRRRWLEITGPADSEAGVAGRSCILSPVEGPCGGSARGHSALKPFLFRAEQRESAAQPYASFLWEALGEGQAIFDAPSDITHRQGLPRLAASAVVNPRQLLMAAMARNGSRGVVVRRCEEHMPLAGHPESNEMPRRIPCSIERTWGHVLSIAEGSAEADGGHGGCPPSFLSFGWGRSSAERCAANAASARSASSFMGAIAAARRGNPGWGGSLQSGWPGCDSPAELCLKLGGPPRHTAMLLRRQR